MRQWQIPHATWRFCFALSVLSGRSRHVRIEGHTLVICLSRAVENGRDGSESVPPIYRFLREPRCGLSQCFVRLPPHVVANMPLFPEVICHAGPALRGMLALLRQIMHIFRALHIGRSSAGHIHHICETFGIVQKRTRPQMIFVEWLPITILHE